MDDECLPTISMNEACGRFKSEITIKDEPFSETDSQHSSCPSSPHPKFLKSSENDSVDKYFPDELVNNNIRNI